MDEKGAQLGVMPTPQALSLAREQGLDLVEIAPHATPPVAKIIDFKKFKYLESKKQKEGSKKSKVEIKEIRFTPFIAEGDLETRLDRIKEFLGDGDRVKIVIKFVGRQITRKEFGYELMERIVKSLAEVARADGEPRLQGKQLYLIINPVRGKTKKEEDTT